MSDAQKRASAQNRNAPDHFPVCPTCQEVQPIGGRWCVECGVWLHLDGPTSAGLHDRAVDAARRRQVASLPRMAPAETVHPLLADDPVFPLVKRGR